MAQYANLIATITDAIKTNGVGAINGQSLQTILHGMVNSLGLNYQYVGIATPSTDPGTPDQNVFYIASTAGTYTNFGGLVLADGEIAILKYNGTWSKDSTGAASSEKVNQLGFRMIGTGNTNNLFNPLEAINNRSLNLDGTIIVRTDNILFISDYIPVNGAEKVYLNKIARRVAFYDENKLFIEINTLYLSTYNVPEGAYFAIFDFQNDYLTWDDRAQLMVSINPITDFETYYGAKSIALDAVKKENIKDSAITTDKIAESAITTQKVADKAIILNKRTASGSSAILVSDRPIDIDFNKGKIVFPNSTNIYLYHGQSYYNVPANTEVSIDLSFGSGYVAFNTQTNTFVCRRYGRAVPYYMGENEIFVFAISNYNVVLDCPHIVNGVPNTDISIYDTHSGIVDYDNTWWKVGTPNYKHIVIPIVGKNTRISVTSIHSGTYMMGLKSYQEPSVNGPITNISDVWVRRIEIPSGKTLNAIVPSDVKFIVLNVLYNNEDCVSDLSVGSENNESKLNTLTIATQNLRDFSNGTGDGCPSELVQTNLPLWKEQFSKFLNADFLTLLEWYPYFDRDRTIQAYETLLEQFFPYKYELPSTNPTRIILSKYPGVLTNLLSFGANLQFDMPMIVCNICGYSVAVVCWLQSSSDPASTRIAAYNSAITVLSGFDKVILAGDFNTEQGLSELQVWKDAGYTLGNGGYWGEINTWEDRTPNDNIVTKGFIFENFEKGERVSSDHNAVRATLRFLTAK